MCYNVFNVWPRDADRLGPELGNGAGRAVSEGGLKG